MKTAISIPDDLFDGADRLARRTGQSRSELYSQAIREYVARHQPDEITAAYDLICREEQPALDEFVAEAARRTLERTEW